MDLARSDWFVHLVGRKWEFEGLSTFKLGRATGNGIYWYELDNVKLKCERRS